MSKGVTIKGITSYLCTTVTIQYLAYYLSKINLIVRTTYGDSINNTRTPMLFQNLLHLFHNSDIKIVTDPYVIITCHQNVSHANILPSFTGFYKKKVFLQVTVKNENISVEMNINNVEIQKPPNR